MASTVTDAFGREAADELAAIAIDLLCDAPENQQRYAATAKVKWGLVHEGRAILERHGIDWRSLVARRVEREMERAEAAHRAKLSREAAKRSTDDLEALLGRLTDDQQLQREVVAAELERRRADA